MSNVFDFKTRKSCTICFQKKDRRVKVLTFMIKVFNDYLRTPADLGSFNEIYKDLDDAHSKLEEI